MSMRVGSVDGKPVKRVCKHSTGYTTVQPVMKVVREDGTEYLANCGEQFLVKSIDFKKHKI